MATSMEASNLKYRYSYDVTGKYSGLVYANELGIFPKNCVSVSPEWFKGYVPFWSESRKSWSNIKRDDVKAYELEFEGASYYSKVITRVVDLRNSDLEKLLKLKYDELLSANKCTIERLEETENTLRANNRILEVEIRAIHQLTKDYADFLSNEFLKIHKKLYALEHKKNSLETIGEFLRKYYRKFTSFLR